MKANRKRHHLLPQITAWGFCLNQPRSCVRFRSISMNLAGQSFEDLFRERTGGAEAGPFLHQVQKYVFSGLTDNSKSLHVNHELTSGERP
jgi:hypothetical protein